MNRRHFLRNAAGLLVPAMAPSAARAAGLITQSGSRRFVSAGSGFLSQNFESGSLGASWGQSADVGHGVTVESGAGVIAGTYSCRLRFPSGQVQGLAELQFDLEDDRPGGVDDLWMYFKLRVPAGYSHVAGIGSNNKLMKWGSHHDGGSSPGINLLWEFWPTVDGGVGSSELAFHWTIPDVNVGSHEQLTRVFGPAEAGTVQEFIMRAKTASAFEVDDGIIQTWHKPAGAGSYTKIHEYLTAPLYPTPTVPTQTTWVGGYLLGASNSGYVDQTDFFLDDIVFSETNLWGVS